MKKRKSKSIFPNNLSFEEIIERIVKVPAVKNKKLSLSKRKPKIIIDFTKGRKFPNR